MRRGANGRNVYYIKINCDLEIDMVNGDISGVLGCSVPKGKHNTMEMENANHHHRQWGKQLKFNIQFIYVGWGVSA